MATYAIGDIQGCFDTLQALLDKLRLGKSDAIWLCGDMVNRGPRSADVLRWARKDRRVTAVLGNHDLHMLAAAAGERERKKRDTLEDVLEARDASELCGWLAQQPLTHESDDWFMVHAGLHPDWSLKTAAKIACECEAAIADGTWIEAWRIARTGPPRWSKKLEGIRRIACALSIFTGARTFFESGEQCVSFAGALDERPAGTRPWFDRAQYSKRVVFGHWAALGFYRKGDVTCIDTGCVWGKALTALRLDDEKLFQQPAVDRR